MDKKAFYISIVSFFAFSGYYVGLALMLAFNLSELSRFYSIPIRLFLCLLMLLLIFKGNINLRLSNVRLIFIFSMLYILKVLYTENTVFDSHVVSTGRMWIEYIFFFIAFNLLPFLAFASIDFNRYRKIIINSFIFSGFVLAIVSIFLYKDILTQGIGRISLAKYENPDSETLSPLALSYSGVLTITLSLYQLIFEKNLHLRSKLFLYGSIVLSFVLFFLGATRGSLVALFLCIVALIYFGSVKNKILIISMVIVAIPIIIYGAEATGSDIFNRTNKTIKSGDTSEREPLWNAAIDEFIDNPILGGRIEVSGIYPHNIFLETLMATGIVGLFLLLLATHQFVVKSYSYIKYDTKYIFPFIIFVNAISQYMFSGSIYFSILFFIPMGMLCSVEPKFISNKLKSM
jgi:O-antigen ligase